MGIKESFLLRKKYKRKERFSKKIQNTETSTKDRHILCTIHI